MTKDEILADLRAVYGRQVLLSPRDIAIAIGRSPKAQANMRSRGLFPIPIKRAGGKVGVSIYDLADYLAVGAPLSHAAGPVVDPSSAAASPDPTLASPPARPSAIAPSKASKASRSVSAAPERWLPARRRKSLGPELLGFRQALEFWGAVHAELEATELVGLTRPRGD